MANLLEDIFLENIKRFPDKPALISKDETLTFSALNDKSNLLAQNFKKLGIKKKDKVLILIPLSVELYLTLIALMKIGAVIIFVDPWMKFSNISKSLEAANPVAAIGDLSKHLIVSALFKSFRKIPLKISLKNKLSLFGIKHTYKDFYKTEPENFISTETKEQDLALITFTTGSTNSPKGFARNCEFLRAQHIAHMKYFKKNLSKPDFNGFPIIILSNIAEGVTSVIPDIKMKYPIKSDPVKIVNQIKKYNVGSITSSPSILQIVTDLCIRENLLLESVEIVNTGGAPVEPKLFSKIARIMPNAKLTLIYGSTECEPISTIDHEILKRDHLEKILIGEGNCVGKQVDGIKLKIIKLFEIKNENRPIKYDFNKIEAPVSEIGEILISGKFVGKFYFKNKSAFFQNKIIDEKNKIWHRLGDLGFLDDEKNIWLVGRINNYFFKNKKIFFPVKIEGVINNLAGVVKAAIFPEKESEENPDNNKVLLVIAHDKTRSESELKAEIEKSLITHFNETIFDRIIFSNKISLDPRHNAKINYNQMRKRFV